MAITSARRVSELAALRHNPPYLKFSDEGVSLATDVTFLPKVVSEFHLSGEFFFALILPTSFVGGRTEVPFVGC